MEKAGGGFRMGNREEQVAPDGLALLKSKILAGHVWWVHDDCLFIEWKSVEHHWMPSFADKMEYKTSEAHIPGESSI